MTFPIIAATSQNNTAAGTSHAITLPSGISVGDLLLVFFATDGDNTITNWGGFTELDQQKDSKDIFGAIGYKIAVGSDTLTITTSVSEPGSYVCYRITGHECDTLPPKISTYVYGATDSPNSDVVTPNWTQNDTLFISIETNDNNSVVTAYPANYTQSQLNQTGGSQECGVGVAGRNLNATSDNPGAFTLDDGEQWFAWTVAVPPDGASPPTGWTGTIDGITNPSHIDGIAVANVNNVDGV